MFYKLLNLVKYNYILKHTYLKINNINKNDFKILKLLIKFNIIRFVKKKENNIIIYFKYLKNNPIFYNIKNLYKPGKLFFISLKEIKKINKKKNNIFILSTNKGLITNFEAEKKKTGGILVFIIHI